MRNLVLQLQRLPLQKNPILHPSFPINSNPLLINRPSTLSFSHRDNHTTPSQSEIMGVSKDELVSSLTSKLSPSHLIRIPSDDFADAPRIWEEGIKEVIDTSGRCGASFMVEIVSEQFEGKRLLERHRMVNAALEKEMKEIHALSITKVLTPEQWKQQQEAAKSEPAS